VKAVERAGGQTGWRGKGGLVVMKFTQTYSPQLVNNYFKKRLKKMHLPREKSF